MTYARMLPTAAVLLMLAAVISTSAVAAERGAFADPTAPPMDALRSLSEAAGLLDRLGTLTRPPPLTLESLTPAQRAPAPPSEQETARSRAEEDEAAGRQRFRMTVVHRDGGHARAYLDDRWLDPGASVEAGRMEGIAPGRMTLRQGDGTASTQRLGASVRKTNLRPAVTGAATDHEEDRL